MVLTRNDSYVFAAVVAVVVVVVGKSRIWFSHSHIHTYNDLCPIRQLSYKQYPHTYILTHLLPP